MTTPNNLTPLRSAIIDLARAYELLTSTHAVDSLTTAYDCSRLADSITATLTASAEKGETDPNHIAQRITDTLKETQERLGIKLTGDGK